MDHKTGLYYFAFYIFLFQFVSLGCIAQSEMCLTPDQGVVSSIPAWSHTFVEIDHEITFTDILLPSADSRRVVVSYKLKYLHKVLVNCFNSQVCPGKKCG